jgi:hypothetical protein
LEHRLLPKWKAERFHSAYQAPLPVTDGSEPLSELLIAPAEVRPIVGLVDIGH